MECQIDPVNLCTSIDNLRIAEDVITTMLTIMIISIILNIIYNIAKKGPLVPRLGGLAIALIPFLLWKLTGAYTRIFLEQSNPLFESLTSFGEIMEVLSALLILGSLVYIYPILKPENNPLMKPAKMQNAHEEQKTKI